jgi:plasmid maintenance system antidote protein VapI
MIVQTRTCGGEKRLVQRTPLGKALAIAVINGDTYENIARVMEIKERTLRAWQSGHRKPPVAKAIRLTRYLGHSSVEELFPLAIDETPH